MELVRAVFPVSRGKPPGKQEREREDVQEKEVCWEWEPSAAFRQEKKSQKGNQGSADIV